MADERKRELERRAAVGDTAAAAAVLSERLRAGELSRDQVELAARLGHSTAAALLGGDLAPIDWPAGLEESLLQASALRGSTLPARVAADWAERALPLWENWIADLGPRHPLTPTPARARCLNAAIAAARAWAECPCDEHAARAQAASREARLAAGFVENLSSEEAGRAASAAACAAEAATTNTRAAVLAAWEASGWLDVQEVLGGRGARSEVEWQRQRLAAHVLDEAADLERRPSRLDAEPWGETLMSDPSVDPDAPITPPAAHLVWGVRAALVLRALIAGEVAVGPGCLLLFLLGVFVFYFLSG